VINYATWGLDKVLHFALGTSSYNCSGTDNAMKLLVAVLPTILLTTYSQLVTKWRVATLATDSAQTMRFSERTFDYLVDPFIISAYMFSLLSSVAWLFVVERHAVSIAFPVYVGAMFALVTIGSALWLKESVSVQHIAGLVLILAGVIVVSRAA
jgi:multidrug transporter EmrE-like cation transporter